MLTPLHFAAWNNSKEFSQLLLERGADIEAQDAASNNSRTVTGADIEAKDTSNLTPYYAAQHNSTSKTVTRKWCRH